MPFNGSGTYAPPAADFPAVALTVISSSKYNALINDIATALSTCVTKDGQTTVTADIPLNTHGITGARDAVAAAELTTLSQNSLRFAQFVGAGAIGDDITLTVAPAPSIYSLTFRQILYFQCPMTNAGAVRIRINALAYCDVLVNHAGLGSGYAAGYFTTNLHYVAIFELGGLLVDVGKIQ